MLASGWLVLLCLPAAEASHVVKAQLQEYGITLPKTRPPRGCGYRAGARIGVSNSIHTWSVLSTSRSSRVSPCTFPGF